MTAPFPPLFEPDAAALLARLARHVDASMLRDIAGADYRQQGSDHYAVLCRMRDKGLVPAPASVPREVLDMVSWVEPDRDQGDPDIQGDRGHWMRAFCCAWLLRITGEGNIRARFGLNEPVAGLVVSLDLLDAGLWAETGALLTWFMAWPAGARDRREEPFLGVALLYCALHVAAVPDPSIAALCRWTVDREEQEVHAPFGTANDDGWLHRLTHFDQRREAWKMLGRKMAGLDLSPRSVEVQEWVALIATSLAEGR